MPSPPQQCSAAPEIKCPATSVWMCKHEGRVSAQFVGLCRKKKKNSTGDCVQLWQRRATENYPPVSSHLSLHTSSITPGLKYEGHNTQKSHVARDGHQEVVLSKSAHDLVVSGDNERKGRRVRRGETDTGQDVSFSCASSMFISKAQ